jgi:hypothetical protein
MPVHFFLKLLCLYLLFFSFFTSIVWLFCLSCVTVDHVCAWALWGQKRASDPLEQKLQAVQVLALYASPLQEHSVLLSEPSL